MNKVYIISFWLVCGLLIACLVKWMNPKDIDALLKYSFPFTFAMFSLNFSAISACSNALLKYKELHQDKNIEIVVQEMKENMMSMLLGIICVFIASILKSAIDKQFFVIACNAVIFAVLIMYLHLIVDIAMAFFRIIEN